MQTSVVVPVYNAADYVRQAVESALARPETAEVILVEDDSPDHSLVVCQELAAEHPLVHLYCHPNGENRGAGAARNLAIRKSTCEYVAFLDADDYFLPGRFSVAKGLFADDPCLEGVYEAVGTHFQSEAARQRWEELGWRKLATMSERVPPEKLFGALVVGGRGSFHLDGLVVKRAVFDKTGLFDEHLRLHQDSAMIAKMAAVARLLPGRLAKPVAVRRVHDRNRISARRPASGTYRMKMQYWHTLWRWSVKHLTRDRQELVLNQLLRHGAFLQRFDRPYLTGARGLGKRLRLLLLLFPYPRMVREAAWWRWFVPHPRNCLRRLGRRVELEPQGGSSEG